MSVERIASRYAKSLMDLATEQGQLEEVLEDVKSFKAATENRDFYLLLKSPIVNATKKEAIFKALFDGKYHKITLSFLDILLRKGRETYLPEIAVAFLTQYKVMLGISSVKVTTASPLSEQAIQEIKNKLAQSPTTAKQIEVEVAVDEDLIGGFVIEYDDKLYDASVAHKLDTLRQKFEDNQYEVKL